MPVPLLMLGAAPAPPPGQDFLDLAPAQSVARGCKPNLAELTGLCASVYGKFRVEGADRYYFARQMRRAACAPTDSEEDLARLRTLWVEQPQAFKCSSPAFEVSQGSILKYDITMRYYRFGLTAVKWKLDLNQIDRSDNRTVLDFLQDLIRANQGNDSLPALRETYDLYRRNGAKHRAELPPTQKGT